MHKAFIIMPFQKDLEAVFLTIKKVCEELKITLTRGDTIFEEGLIINQIQDQIKDADVVFADISMSNPNVMYEIGYAHAFNKPTILLLNKNDKEKVPFDIQSFRYFVYENMDLLKDEMFKYLFGLASTDFGMGKQTNLTGLNLPTKNDTIDYIESIKKYVRKTFDFDDVRVQSMEKRELYTYIKFTDNFQVVLVKIDINGTVLQSGIVNT